MNPIIYSINMCVVHNMLPSVVCMSMGLGCVCVCLWGCVLCV